MPQLTGILRTCEGVTTTCRTCVESPQLPELVSVESPQLPGLVWSQHNSQELAFEGVTTTESPQFVGNYYLLWNCLRSRISVPPQLTKGFIHWRKLSLADCSSCRRPWMICYSLFEHSLIHLNKPFVVDDGEQD